MFKGWWQEAPCLWWSWLRTPEDGDTEVGKAPGAARVSKLCQMISFRARDERRPLGAGRNASVKPSLLQPKAGKNNLTFTLRAPPDNSSEEGLLQLRGTIQLA